MGGPQSADKKFVWARGPQNWNPEVFDQTRCSRILRVEVALNNRELVKGEKSVRANDNIKMKEMKGAFSLNKLLVGTVRPPDLSKLIHLEAFSCKSVGPCLQEIPSEGLGEEWKGTN